MCYSKAEGGARCSSHAEAALSKSIGAYAEHLANRDLDNDDQEAEQAENARLRSALAEKRFEYATTPEGRAAMEADIARQQERVNQYIPPQQSDGPGTVEHPKTLPDTSYQQDPGYQTEHQTLRNMQDTLRSASKVRAAQDAARDRRKEVQNGDIGPCTTQALADEPEKHAENAKTQDDNGNWHSSTVIGAVAVDEPFTVTDNSYEVAAWNTTHQVQPGVYPISLTDRGDLQYSFDTTVTDEHLPSLLGGVAYGEGPKDSIGKPSKLHRHPYSFTAPMAYTPGIQYGGGSLVLRNGVDLDYTTSTRGGVTQARAHFAITDAVEGERRYSESRRRREPSTST